MDAEPFLRDAEMQEGEKRSVDCLDYEPPHNTRCFQWVPTDAQQLARSESRMLHSISHLIEQETVAGLNTIMSRNHPTSTRHVLLVHGFAGGVANWLPTWKVLVEHTNVYAIDLPGFARSHRPSGVQFGSALDAIEFMTDGILLWLREMGLIRPPPFKVDLCGHSFGAYISSNFALRHPQIVDRLILSEPWGCGVEYHRKLSRRFRYVLKILYHINPLMLLRCPWGHTILPKQRKDFGEMWKQHIDDPRDFYDYAFHCNAISPPVGEQAFLSCAKGQLFAKFPLEILIPESIVANTENSSDRAAGAPRQPIEEVASMNDVRVGVIFGAETWLDTEAGERMMKNLKAKGGRTAVDDVLYVPKASHQVMSDNAEDYNLALLEMLGYAQVKTRRHPRTTARPRKDADPTPKQKK